MKTYSEAELAAIHSIQLSILSEIIRVCKELSIIYVALFGTSLGAERHKGFIPWDDDIDIGMPRKDYELFLRMAPKYLRKGFHLSHFYSEKSATTYFIKIKKDGTSFIEKGEKKLNIHHGIFVDIFPIDKVPSDRRIIKKYKFRIKILNQLFSSKIFWTAPFYKGVKVKYILSNFVRVLLHLCLLPVKRSFLFNILDREIKKYSKIENGCDTTISMKVFNEDILFPTKTSSFEGMMINVPNKNDEYLTLQYGNYQELPPLNLRHGHKPQHLDIGDN